METQALAPPPELWNALALESNLELGTGLDSTATVFLVNVTESLYEYSDFKKQINNICKKVFIPITIGGGIRSMGDVDDMFRVGADKIAINSVCFDNIEIIKGDSIQNKKFEIPVCCEKEFSLDIKRLEEKLKMKEEKIYESFFEKEFFCYMTGFIAGMPFLGDLDENLRAKRLDTPRVKVPKGSIGLTEQFANIYTFESPGGWNIIGNTPLNIFDSTKEKEPNLINPGDLVTFKRISKEKYQNYHE